MSFLEYKHELQQLNNAWHAFREENDKKLRDIAKSAVSPLTEQKIARLNDTIDQCKQRTEALEAAYARPDNGGVLSEKNTVTESYAHRKAFGDYLRKGVNSGLDTLEKKSLSIGSDSDGGYLVSSHISQLISRVATESSVMRQLATVETVSTDTLDVIEDYDDAGAGWTTETGAVSDSSTPSINRRSIDTHEMYAQPKATQKLLDDAAIDAERWLADKIAEEFTELENSAFISGDGSGKPAGILGYPAGSAWGQIEQVSSGTSGELTADGLLELYYSLKTGYTARASFIMSRGAAQQARGLKDASGRYLWSPGLSEGRPDTLLGAPVYVDAAMPAPAADSLSAIFGDIGSAYRIADRTGIRVLRDPYTEKPYVKFYATKRVGGAVVNFEAAKILAFSA